MNKFVPPEFNKAAFNCPHCHAFAGMTWEMLTLGGFRSPMGFISAQCQSCKERSIWRSRALDRDFSLTPEKVLEADMVYPLSVSAVPAHSQMPELIRDDFEEARQIASISPRSAAALLRLCLEKLCQHLTGTTNKIDTQIADLVEKGLPRKIQQALDTVRVVGNEAVHPGTLDLRDGEKFVYPLFQLINLIIEDQIASPNAINDLFDLLPEEKRKGIEQRDAKRKDAGKK
ncbi:DUF4145 domain-containing protein [Pseudomonas sp. GM30]|uniref:DUF4145 domain-containing protein n=1 Tax=Pseudomonas sp. GM30 TaxID=1144328 RepID=UPI0002700CA6|nr:DUF4145 domain-containing protein [Pseudomonas sp. GM30]EUB82769.1 protein of unknown function DUF4145 [Pseudomonas sp. GM30]